MANAMPTPPSNPYPKILVTPGNNDLASIEWTEHWEDSLPGAVRLELGTWENPHRNTWVNRLNLAVLRSDRPVIIVASGLACLAVAWWAEYERPGNDGPLRAALMIDPPDVDRPGSDPRLAAFPSTPRSELPFPTCILTSKARPMTERRSIQQLARDWNATFDIFDGQVSASLPISGHGEALGRRFLLTAIYAGG